MVTIAVRWAASHPFGDWRLGFRVVYFSFIFIYFYFFWGGGGGRARSKNPKALQLGPEDIMHLVIGTDTEQGWLWL